MQTVGLSWRLANWVLSLNHAINIDIGGYAVAAVAGVADYDETPIAAHMKSQMIDIKVTVGTDDGTAKFGLAI